MKYRTDIDGLRAIAVLAVVFFHAFPKAIPSGFIGVDIFFVLSGFLISNILFYQIKNGSISWSNFYLKRIKRIFPALILVLLTSAVMGYFLLLPDEYKNLGKHLLGSSVFVNNLLLWREVGYFDKASELKPLLHLWSLGIEEQFYLIWPMFIYFIWKFRFNPIIALVLFSIISFSINILWVNHHHIMAFYFPISRFWELAAGGVVVYILYHHLPDEDWQRNLISKRYILINVMSICSLLILVIGIFLNQKLTYPGWAALLPTLCTIVLLITRYSWINCKLLTLPLLTFVGLISYPLYLWHWVLLSFARIIYSGTPSTNLIITTILLSFILAWLTYQFIEKPIRFTLKEKKYQPYIAILLCLSLILVGFLGFIIKKNEGFGYRFLNAQQNILMNDIKSFDQYKTQTINCELKLHNQNLTKLTSCLQTKKGKPNKVIWGDSHAEHLLPGILKFDKKNNWLLLEQSGCPPLLNVASFWKGSEDKCIQANKIILQTILGDSSIDTVILASLGAFYISNESCAPACQGEYAASRHCLKSEAKTKQSTRTKNEIFYKGLTQIVSQLKSAGKKVILFQDIPEIPFMPESCIKRPFAPPINCVIQKIEIVQRQKNYIAILDRIKREQDILLYDPNILLCDQNTCSVIRNQHLIYRDSHHLSIAGSEFIAEKFVPWINRNS